MRSAVEELFYPAFLADVPVLREILDRVEAELVSKARDHGRSWLEIGLALGVTRQSVHRKHGERVRTERATRTRR